MPSLSFHDRLTIRSLTGILTRSYGYRSDAGRRGVRVDRRHRVDLDRWLDLARWVRVSSSNVREIRYDASEHKLQVCFKSGGCYTYSSVPMQVAKDFFLAGSMGRFHWRRIRDQYEFSRGLT